MVKKILKFFIVASFVSILILPARTYAVDWFPLVPCGLNQQPVNATRQDLDADGKPIGPHDYTQQCNQCLLVELGKNIIDMTFYAIVPSVGTLLFLIAGFIILFNARSGNSGGVGKGKEIMTNTAIGIAIILSSWLITNFILKSIANDQVAGTPWYQIQCRVGSLKDITDVTLPTVGGPPTVPSQPTVPATCSNLQQLATSNNEPYPKKNAPELDQLISCIKSKLSGKNLGSEYTYDNSYDMCNYTRGQKTCSASCSHVVNSCHYGGKTGTQGSLAVDFGNEAIGSEIIQAAISCGVPSGKARCENAAGVNVGCASGSGTTHVHISAASCDAN